MSNPVFTGTAAKREAKSQMDAAAAEFAEAKRRYAQAKEIYTSAKTAASIERRKHFNGIAERRQARKLKEAK